MNAISEALFNLLLNSSLQMAFLASLVAAFSRLVARSRAKHQHLFYVAALLFCLAVPVINTLWPSPSSGAREKRQRSDLTGAASGYRDWNLQRDVKQHRRFAIAPALGNWISTVWAVFVLLQLARFSLAVRRVQWLRRDAFELSPAQARISGQIIAHKSKVRVLESAAIDDPVTIGVFRPLILLPSKVLPDLGQEEISAVVAHEYSHILRKDFLIHMLCELISLPLSWHPGIVYLMSKISQSRELACDEYAATCFGNRRSYANTLLRLASLCLHVSRLNTAGVRFFDGDNLEARITMLTGKTLSLSRTSVIGLALAMSITFSAGAVVAHAMSFQASGNPSRTADDFVGTWHWMFEGRHFVTMVLARNHAQYSGTVTGSRIALNEDGALSRADPSEDVTPKPITKATREGSALHITVMDGNEPFEFVVTLRDATHAEIHPKKAPSKMKPIAAEKAS
jgi:beta-lactamase regulating signal transducer with metallopeptidase domain